MNTPSEPHDNDAQALSFTLPPRQFLDTLAVCDLDYPLAEASRLRRRANDDASSWFTSSVFTDALATLAGYAALTLGLVMSVGFGVLALSAPSLADTAWGSAHIYLIPAVACMLALKVARPFHGALAHARLRYSALVSPTKQAQRDLLVQVVARLRPEHGVTACAFEGRWDAWTLRLICDDGEALALSVRAQADALKARVSARGAPEYTVDWAALDLTWAGQQVRLTARTDQQRGGALLAPLTLRAGRQHEVGTRAREDLAALIVRLMDARAPDAQAAHPELLAWDMRAALCDAALPALVSRRAPTVTQPAGMGVRAQAMSRALVSWLGWGALGGAGLLYSLVALLVAATMIPAQSTHNTSIGFAFAMSACWVTAVLLAGAVKHVPLWPKRSALAARTPIPEVLVWSDERLSVGASGAAIRWARPFRAELTRDPQVRDGRVLVTFDLRQTPPSPSADPHPDAHAAARVRFAVALPYSDALAALPALTTDAPLLHADHLRASIWPLLRDSADAHGVALPRALATLDAPHLGDAIAHVEVARAPARART